MRKRVCIVTSGHIGSDPRAAKEADALFESGFDVHVVAADITPGVRPLDHDVMLRSKWTLHRVGRGRAGQRYFGAIRERCARWLWRSGLRSTGVAQAAIGRLVGALTTAAAGVHADLYIGHNLPGLVAAGSAALAVDAKLAFDAEDDHIGELPPGPRFDAERELRFRVQSHWLRRCAYRTAASPMMAEQLEGRFGLPFVCVLNTFPISDAAGLSALESAPSAARFYWFSQTVGPGRGLEWAIELIARLPGSASLHLRGNADADYARTLQAHARAVGMDETRLEFLPTANPADMTRLAHGYALGLSLEEKSNENKLYCLGNKIFQYLLAGLPVLLSDTPAQRKLAGELGDAAVLVDMADPDAAAASVAKWLEDAGQRQHAHRAAWDLARARFNWDTERTLVVTQVSEALALVPGLSTSSRRVCIVTSGHIGSNPRAAKEANALCDAGYEVDVVAADITPDVRPLDLAVARNAAWSFHRVGRSSAFRWIAGALLERCARIAWDIGIRTDPVTDQAISRLVVPLSRAAAALRADLYIGHNLPGFVAAARAAGATGAMLAFDAEDDHVGELPDTWQHALERSRRAAIQDQCANACVFRIAAAPLMAEKLRERFGCEFVTINNVFPRADSPDKEPPVPTESPARFYWFSQTIGPGRGLEEVIETLARVRTPVALEMRGYEWPGYGTKLRALAANLGFDPTRLTLLPTAMPMEMSRLAVGYALGLSPEIVTCENRERALVNKTFQYLLAGLPTLLTPTLAQRKLAQELGDAVVMVDLNDPASAAQAIDRWLGDTAQRAQAHRSAWRLARDSFNWETESVKLVSLVNGAFQSKSLAPI